MLATLACQHRCGVRGRLPRAWRALRNWRLEEPLRTRPPIPRALVLVHAFACFARSPLEAGIRRLQLLIGGVLLLVGFFGLLRPREMARLLRNDICLPSDVADVGETFLVIITITNPKMLFWSNTV